MALNFDFTYQAVYTPRRLGALAGVSGNTIGQWARNSLIQPTVAKGLPSNLYSFFDAAEAIAVRWLLDEGFTYKQIHNAIEGARREDERAGKKHAAWPLSRSKIGLGRATADTEHDHGSIVLRNRQEGYLDVTHGYDQFAFKPEFWLAIGDVLRSGGWIARELHLTKADRSGARAPGGAADPCGDPLVCAPRRPDCGGRGRARGPARPVRATRSWRARVHRMG